MHQRRLHRILVAGIGNLLMGDDGFGPRVIEILQDMDLPENVELRDVGTAGLMVSTDLEDYDVVIFVDSMEGNADPGTIQKVEIDTNTIDSSEAADLSKLTVHEIGLEGLLKFSKAIGTLPEKVFLIGCIPENFNLGVGLSSKVEQATAEAVEVIRKLLLDLGIKSY
jgi:hydrogenase maturation protease